MHVARIARTSGVALVALVAIGCSSGGTSATPTTNASAANAPTTAAASGKKPAPGATLPAEWPEELRLPADATLVEATKPSETSMYAKADITDAKAAFDALKAQLTDDGYEIVGSTFTPSDKGGFGSISAKGTAYTAAISFGPDPARRVSQVIINVAKVES